MRMVRFKEDLKDGEDIIWQQGNIYKIIYEDKNTIWLENDAINNKSYAINKSDLGSYCFIYNCNGTIGSNCQYCKALSYDEEVPYCSFIEGVG